jgi:Na+-translocating ferredoxin:NAD+ oxidoreductase subunit G
LNLRVVIKIISPALLGLLALAGAARAERAETTYHTTRSMLAEFFPRSERVTFRTFSLTAAQKLKLRQRLGYTPPRDSYTIFVATTADKIDGYAVVDDEKGQHLPITFATRLSPRAVVERLQVMVYREPRGDEVRDARFLAQFAGKSSQDPLRLDHDVDAVSGATISSASLATGVKRAAVLVEELALSPPTFTAAKSR